MLHLKKYWDAKSLTSILFLAFTARMLAVVFSKGFGWHDDHFLVVEAAQSFVEGGDYNNWLPANSESHIPSGHSWFYPGLHFILFWLLEKLHLHSPQGKMYVVRFLHALYSLSIVYFGYRITEKAAGRTAAGKAGLLLALLWFIPFLSVRNLVEWVCIPPLLGGLWIITKYKDATHSPFSCFLIAGFIIGLAFSIRYQSFLFIAGIGLSLIILKQWKAFCGVGAGVILSALLFQGVVDYFIWHRPFAEFREYIVYNWLNAHEYLTNTWYSYILLLSLILIPPVSILLLMGTLRIWRSQLMLFLPVLLFIVFHSLFPNKQERFILPVVPFIVILGIIGTADYTASRFVIFSWRFFWILNLLLLPIVSTMYSKKARVESMTFLARMNPPVSSLLIEDSNMDGTKLPPKFYLGNIKIPIGELTLSNPINKWRSYIKNGGKQPDYILFIDNKNLKSRIDTLTTLFPKMHFIKTIEPGLIDKLLYKLNPRNSNQEIYLYKVG